MLFTLRRLRKNLVLAIFLIPSYALALSCMEYRSTYEIRDGIVWFFAYGPFSERRVPELRAELFQPVHPPGYGTGPCTTFINDYASDGKKVFYRGVLIEGAELTGFKIFGDGYSADAKAVYGNTKRITNRVTDFKKVGVLATDGTTVFFQNRRLEGGNLEAVSGVFGIYRTSKAVYDYHGEKIAADPSTIRVLAPNHGLWRDKTKVFLRSKLIKRADPESLEIIGSYFYRDKRAVYLDGKEIPGLNPLTARQFSIQGLYSTDGKRVFKGYVPIDRDAKSFNASMQPWYTKDKNGIYYNDALMQGADIETFEATSLNGARDKNYSYGGKTPHCTWHQELAPEMKLCKP